MVLCCRDPKARPSAKDALQDPWLKGNSTERNQGKPIDATVVQRIQVSIWGPHALARPDLRSVFHHCVYDINPLMKVRTMNVCVP